MQSASAQKSSAFDDEAGGEEVYASPSSPVESPMSVSREVVFFKGDREKKIKWDNQIHFTGKMLKNKLTMDVKVKEELIKEEMDVDMEIEPPNEQEQEKLDKKQKGDFKFQSGVKPEKPKITTAYMTKYEKARILGTRALQISMGAPVMVEIQGETDPLEIAAKELREKKIPMIIRLESSRVEIEVVIDSRVDKKKKLKSNCILFFIVMSLFYFHTYILNQLMSPKSIELFFTFISFVDCLERKRSENHLY
ncbi:hypothetical protein RFI_09461 [Reticulomyxa filosa]|uniref:Uncharacterized protein n=1 Tax=Reticulomyxa filosa TaxID=46433 RepID=X6NNT0_RETFI|nr:hypothetical protein RFI_09461 [Reticulomyxa filosa]|eukprot:ETO27671.1 hypothetical protein RFI_09461 [Reticulomyxa filosa]